MASKFSFPSLAFLVLWAVSSSQVGVLHADQWPITGALGIAAEPEVSAQLALSPEQGEQLRELLKRRQNEWIGMSGELRQADPATRQSKLAEFTAASEREAMALLSVEQRAKLEQVRISRKGFLALAEPAIAESLSLSDEQKATVAKSAEAYFASSLEDRDAAHAKLNSDLGKLLDEKQTAGWRKLAGTTEVAVSETSVAAAAAPMPSPAANSETSTVVASSTAGEPAMKKESEMKDGGEEASPSDQTEKPVEAVAGGDTANAEIKKSTNPDELTINFQAAPWQQVLKWLADEADLSLQVDTFPTGTFTYRDPYRTYTISQAMDVCNNVLLNKGYTLVRRQRLLIVVDLEQDISAEVVRELAELVSVEDLIKRGDYELLKCLFSVSRMSPEEAEAEIKKLLGPQGSVISFPASGQLLVTETAGKLRTIQEMIKRVEDPLNSRGSSIVAVPLKNVSAEEVLTVARPLLGMSEGSNVSEKISVSTDTFGTTIFATGTADNIQKLRDLAEQLDKENSTTAGNVGATETPYIRSHRIIGSDPETAYQVMQNLLAGMPDVLMSLDSKTNQLIIQARKSEHDLVEKTLKEISGQNESFEVVQLQKLDPETVILAVNKFYGGSSDGKEASATGPIVDGDPLNRTLWVKGSVSQIEQVKNLVTQLEGTSSVESDTLGDKVRMVPLTGRAADRALEQMEVLWGATQNKNKIRIVTPANRQSSSLPKRSVSGELPAARTKAMGGSEGGEGFDGAAGLGGSALSPEMLETLRGMLNSRGQSLNEAAPTNSNEGEKSDKPDANEAEPTSEKPSEPSTEEPAAEQPAIEPGDKKDLSAAKWKSSRFVLTSVVQQESEKSGESAEPATQEPAKEPAPQEPAPQEPTPAQPAEGSVESEKSSEEGGTKLASPFDDIIVMRGPNGLIITSEDKKALAQFESLMRMLAEQEATGTGEPTVFYLQYIRAQAASELLEGILNGQSSGGGGGGGGGLLGSMLGEMGGGLIGGLLGGGGGGSSSSTSAKPLATGEVSIIPDPRLNALIVQANGVDLQLVEQLLEVIDQEDSPLDVSTRGKPRLIPVLHQDANEVAEMVKTLFADRMQQQAGAAQRQPSPQEFLQALRGGGGGRGGRGGGAQSELKENSMSISVDRRSNSLIVTSTQSLYDEVKAAVELIDQAGADSEESVQVVELGGNVNPEVVRNALTSILGSQVTSNSSSTNNTNQRNSRTNNGQTQSFDPAALQQRMEFFRNLQQGGRGGQGGGTFSFPAGGFGGGTGGRGFGGGGTGGGFGGFGGGNTGGNRGGFGGGTNSGGTTGGGRGGRGGR